MNLLRSGDVELNPGPLQNVDNQTRYPIDSLTLLNFRLGQLRLIALDVGVPGDCFLRAISHQLYGNPIMITFTSDKLLFNTSEITLNVSLEATIRIHGMVT